MDTEKKSGGGLKTLLEFGPVMAFFVGYMWLKDRVFVIGGTEYEGFIVVTALFVPLMILSTYLVYLLTGELSKMQVVTLVLVVVFGGLTIWFNDPQFIKMKPSILYGVFAATLGVGLLQGKSYLQYVMADMLPMTQEGWMILTKRFCLLFLGLLLANEIVWRNFSDDTWVYFKTFGLPLLSIVFIMANYKLFETYAPQDSGEESQ